MEKAFKLLHKENTQLKAENAALKLENAELRAENKALKAEIIVLQTTIKQLMARLEDLERRLKLDPQTSHKPSGAEPFRKPISTRGKTNKPSGGQNGHVGKTLAMTDTPDEIKIIPVNCCEKCQADLSQQKSKRNRRAQVFDLPDPRIIVREFQTEEKNCVCGHTTVSKLPKGVQLGAQYGSLIRIITSYLNSKQLIPEERVADVMHDLFGVDLCSASVGNHVIELSEKVKPYDEANHKAAAGERVKHSDETWFRIRKLAAYLQVLSTKTHTHYKPTFKRGDIIRTTGGVLVSDHFVSYKTLENIRHAFCNAHHIRELEAVSQHDKEPWAASFKKLLQFACHRAKSPNIQHYQPAISRRFDELIEKGLVYHALLPPLESKSGKKNRKSYNLLIRLRDNKESVLRFLYEEDVPFTNNLAERDLRMMKVKQKISGGFRSMEGAEHFCRIRGVMSTLQKQNTPLLPFMKSLYPSIA